MSGLDTLPLDRIDVADPRLYWDDRWQPYFARLRREAPVHYCPESEVVGEPVRAYSNFLRGIKSLPVRIA